MMRMIRGSLVGEGEGLSDERIAQVANDFITFCYMRRGAGWPSLYDEMCYVAGNRLYRGLGYEELAQAGLDFTLGGLGKTSRLVNEVTKRHARHGAFAPAT
jgi:hypothetical protein